MPFCPYTALCLKRKCMKSIICALILFLFCFTSIANEKTILVTLETTLGNIELELYPEKAPISVNSFIRYVESGNYNKGKFTRVVHDDNQDHMKVKIHVVQGGTENPEEIIFPMIAHETTQQTGLKHLRGTISLGRLAPGTASSEFFICNEDEPSLDFGGLRNPDGQGFAAFGTVVNGMDVADKILRGKVIPAPKNPAKMEYTSGQILQNPVKIIKAYVTN
jgi:peptidyl-prolyl cis-trans isomerase A (cyclophilin A)